MEIKLGNTFGSGEKFEKKKKNIFLFSGDTEIFITRISLPSDRPIYGHLYSMLSLCYGGHNVPCMKNFY